MEQICEVLCDSSHTTGAIITWQQIPQCLKIQGLVWSVLCSCWSTFKETSQQSTPHWWQHKHWTNHCSTLLMQLYKCVLCCHVTTHTGTNVIWAQSVEKIITSLVFSRCTHYFKSFTDCYEVTVIKLAAYRVYIQKIRMIIIMALQKYTFVGMHRATQHLVRPIV